MSVSKLTFDGTKLDLNISEAIDNITHEQVLQIMAYSTAISAKRQADAMERLADKFASVISGGDDT